MDAAGYTSALALLLRDFATVCEYVEPRDENLGTFSHRLYEIILRSCTECESLWKDALLESGCRKAPTRMNISDYRGLETSLQLASVEVGWHLWLPAPAYVSPFDGWSLRKPPLRWYEDYGILKHNRSTEFHRASLEVARLALSGLFATIARLSLIDERYLSTFEVMEQGLVDKHFHRFPQITIRASERRVGT